ncbi:MAG: hypothetical protein QG652_1044 [Pseudomonadota bacterium]|nr:hypothetical protein [Pseudomonadota bacterium]
MKRLVLALLLAIIVAVTIAVINYRFGSGYVVVSFADISIETSFIFAASVLTLSFFVFYYAMRALAFIVRMPLYLRLRARQRRAEQARQSLIKGLIEFHAGHFADAEKILLKQAPHSDTTLLNYMVAARAAHQQGADSRRDEYLKLAQNATPNAEVAVAITQAELQMAHQQYEQALATLKQADSLSPKNNYIKKLLASAYEQLADWSSLSNMLDDLRKNRLLAETDFNNLEISTYQNLLRQLSLQKNTQDVTALWQRLPRHLKDNSAILQIYIEHLLARQQSSDAETLLRNHLGKNWHEPLVLLYGQINSDKPQQQLETAEAWLPNHRNCAELLLVTGKLCVKNKLWGKARTYLEASLGIKPMAETYMHLAMLLEDKMQEPVKAQQHYQQGLKLAVRCGECAEPVAPAAKNVALPLRVV